VHLGSINLFLK